MRMMLLEDDDRVARGIVRITVALGHEAVHCRTIDCAKRAMQEQPFDLILADLGLGQGECGLDLLHWARERFPGVRRVLASGAVYPTGFAIEPPMQVFLRKPFGRAELVEVLAGSDAAHG
jgi:DNA-binding response OmpR family regulator